MTDEPKLDETEILPPGEHLRMELEAHGWSQIEFAQILGRTVQTVSGLVTGARGITPRMARDLAAATGRTAEYWLGLAAAFELTKVTKSGSDTIARRAKLYKKAPVREMVKRGWIEPTKDVDELEHRVLRFLGMRSIDDEPILMPPTARKSTPYDSVTPSQLAWLCRARQLAQAAPAENFTTRRFESALHELKHNLQSPEEIRRVPRILADGGVRLVVVEHLDGTKVDGWCFWLNRKSPVVALSMRFGRIDNFWFTLMHELGHVAAGDGAGEKGCAVDIDLLGESGTDVPKVEELANEFARSFLIDPEKLRDFIVRVGPTYRPVRIMGFAKLHHIHPGLLIGQLQHLGEIGYGYGRDKLVDVRNYLFESALVDGWDHPPLATAQQ